jgi:cadmium resistance protein CadD (predicted permease)
LPLSSPAWLGHGLPWQFRTNGFGFLVCCPLAIGFKDLVVQHRGTAAERHPQTTYSLASIALITLSNGADNIGIYVPFFVVARSYLWLILIAYAVLLAIWCFVARWLGQHELILRSVDRWGHWVVPLVFIGLGIYVLVS